MGINLILLNVVLALGLGYLPVCSRGQSAVGSVGTGAGQSSPAASCEAWDC